MTQTADTLPIPVHISNAEALAGKMPAKVRNAIVWTRNIAAGQIIDLCPYDVSRLYVQVQAGGSNVVICTDLSQAQDPGNLVAALTNPVGLVLGAGNTFPYKIEGVQRMWAVAPSAAQLTWCAVHERTS